MTCLHPDLKRLAPELLYHSCPCIFLNYSNNNNDNNNNGHFYRALSLAKSKAQCAVQKKKKKKKNAEKCIDTYNGQNKHVSDHRTAKPRKVLHTEISVNELNCCRVPQMNTLGITRYMQLYIDKYIP